MRLFESARENMATLENCLALGYRVLQRGSMGEQTHSRLILKVSRKQGQTVEYLGWIR